MKPSKTWSRVNRWRRRCGFDDNDLRRRVDRVQWLSGLLLLVVFLVVTPALCARVVEQVNDSGSRAERYEAPPLRQHGPRRGGRRRTRPFPRRSVRRWRPSDDQACATATSTHRTGLRGRGRRSTTGQDVRRTTRPHHPYGVLTGSKG